MGPRPRAGNLVGAPRVRHDTQMEGRQEDLEGREVPSDLADREAMGNPPSPVVVASVAPYVHAAWEAGSPWNGHQAQGPSSWSCHRSSSCSCAFASRGHSGSAGSCSRCGSGPWGGSNIGRRCRGNDWPSQWMATGPTRHHIQGRDPWEEQPQADKTSRMTPAPWLLQLQSCYPHPHPGIRPGGSWPSCDGSLHQNSSGCSKNSLPKM
mmetsp:Transcript_20173/g.44535  ORF Transcript_20173/g.44535 Transcript_20173/m.44535 type:complete len:208 (-) Transcript_20173:286-909(-)